MEKYKKKSFFFNVLLINFIRRDTRKPKSFSFFINLCILKSLIFFYLKLKKNYNFKLF